MYVRISSKKLRSPHIICNLDMEAQNSSQQDKTTKKFLITLPIEI